jgi:hypothetical protein
MSLEPNQHFVPGYGISRKVIQQSIPRYLGPGAIARPYVHEVRNYRHFLDAAKLTDFAGS